MKKYFIRFWLFILPIIVLSQALIWIYETPKRQAIKNVTYQKFIKWNDIKNSKNKFDNIILGSSRGYCAYNPMIIDSITNTNTYNMGTGSQNIVETYYILKEIFKYQKPEFVIYETFLPGFTRDPDYYHALGNAEFMSTQGKWDMILNGFGFEGLSNVLFPMIYYKTYLKQDFSNILKPRKTTSENSFWINGYFFDDKKVDSIAINNFPPIYSFKNTSVTIEYIEYHLNLINELCKKNNVKLICVRAPYPPTRLKISEPDSFNSYFKDYSNRNNISFYDFNYQTSNKYNDSDFTDFHHMNYLGANKVSKELAKILLNARTQKLPHSQ
jgi:hypothetical protein